MREISCKGILNLITAIVIMNILRNSEITAAVIQHCCKRNVQILVLPKIVHTHPTEILVLSFCIFSIDQKINE